MLFIVFLLLPEAKVLLTFCNHRKQGKLNNFSVCPMAPKVAVLSALLKKQSKNYVIFCI